VVLFELKANIFTQFCVGLPLLGIKKTALRIGLIQIHSKNETDTFEKIFWVQGCSEDYFLLALNYIYL
jgi:hypothetical protein